MLESKCDLYGAISLYILLSIFAMLEEFTGIYSVLVEKEISELFKSLLQELINIVDNEIVIRSLTKDASLIILFAIMN